MGLGGERGQGSGISFGQGPLRQVFLLALGVPAKNNHTVKRLKTPGGKKNKTSCDSPSASRQVTKLDPSAHLSALDSQVPKTNGGEMTGLPSDVAAPSSESDLTRSHRGVN